MAKFQTGHNYQFTFINHSNSSIQYDLEPATGGNHNEINGEGNPGQTFKTNSFDNPGTLEQGNVLVFTITAAYAPNFRF